MSFSAKLLIDDKKYEVQECTFDFEQQLDHSGKPSGAPRGGILLITLKFTSDTSLISWMVEPSMTKNGKLLFPEPDGSGNMMTILFTNAYCAKLSGHYSHVGADPIKLRIKISAETMKLNSVNFKNNWPQKSQ
ncbi:MAG: type VI secretion system tube protein TssD [Aequorivita sp.]